MRKEQLSGKEQAINPATMLDVMPLSGLQYVIFALCFILNMIDGMDVVILSYSASSIMADLNITPIQMGGIFSAGLIGMAFGGLILGAYADKAGRRRIILIGVTLIAVGVIAGSQAQSISQLIVTRLIAGFGIGGMFASVTAIVAEYSPLRIRNIVIMLITAGYPLGALLTGLSSSWAVPEFGWRATMIGAGSITALMLPICFVFLPESLFFLAREGGDGAVRKINRVMGRMKHPEITGPIDSFFDSHGKTSFRDLLNPQYRRVSLRLWAGLICTFMTMYYLLSWIPKIAIDSGLAPDKAIIAGAMFSGGGFIGVMVVGLLANRFGYIRSIVSYCITAFVMMIIFSVYRGELTVVLLIAFVMGFTVQGAVGAFYGAAARAYPVQMKSTGIGWTIGVGRIGAIIGPYFGGILMSMALPQLVNFTIYGAIMLLGAAFVFPLKSSKVNQI
ncbi:MAG: MFS transporter [Alphaproteobacteria bacterium]|nr:MAG: MFS transporter [Alphaproteobacteria bacterium]